MKQVSLEFFINLFSLVDYYILIKDGGIKGLLHKI